MDVGRTIATDPIPFTPPAPHVVVMRDHDDATEHTPRSLIVTTYGLYARQAGGWLSIAALIRLMAACGIDAPAVRSAIFRLKRRGLLDAQKVSGVAEYALSEHARGVLQEGDRRIFQRRRASLGEGWVLVVFSVPETARDRRHQLRSRLTWLGFGTVSAGVWIAPAHLLEETRAVLARSELDGFTTMFQAHHVGLADLEHQIAQWWDLPGLSDLYRSFHTRYAPLQAEDGGRPPTASGQVFADHLRLLTDWRRLPFLDPGLPAELLPTGWPGLAACDLFRSLHETLAPPAQDYADSILRSG